ncbi:LytR family transcriptional regulator, partial [Streptomyces sp. T-3]|nr:LytR family transcriptional regulator [Streptomyces sp. T-3]
MDAQGRGRAENIDPADQWVLNPQTGDYELRLNPSAGQGQSGIPGPRRTGRGARSAPGTGRRQGGTTEGGWPSVDSPRRRGPAPERGGPG